MRKEDKKTLITYLVTLGFMLLFAALWQFLELMLYGEIQHRVVDDIISLPIMYSIYLNVNHWLEDSNI